MLGYRVQRFAHDHRAGCLRVPFGNMPNLTNGINVIVEAENETFVAPPGVTPTQVYLSKCSNCKIEGVRFENYDLPSNADGDDGAIQILDCDGIHIRNCLFDSIGPTSNWGSREFKYVAVKRAANCIVECCTFSNKKVRDTALGVISGPVPDRITIRNCLFKNIGPVDSSYDGNGFECIRLGSSDRSMESSYSLIEACVFVNCGSPGEPETISIKRSDITVQLCAHYNCQAGMTSRHGKRNKFLQNYFSGGKIGFRLIDSDHVAEGNYIENQTGEGGSSFRYPFSLVNGMPNSLPNGYFPANNCVLRANTLVNNLSSYGIGINGGNSALTIPVEYYYIFGGDSPYATGALAPLTESDVGYGTNCAARRQLADIPTYSLPGSASRFQMDGAGVVTQITAHPAIASRYLFDHMNLLGHVLLSFNVFTGLGQIKEIAGQHRTILFNIDSGAYRLCDEIGTILDQGIDPLFAAYGLDYPVVGGGSRGSAYWSLAEARAATTSPGHVARPWPTAYDAQRLVALDL